MNDKKFNTGTVCNATFWEILFLTFMVLKLTNVITWSWLVVLSPLIAEVVLGCIIMFVIDEKRNR